MSRLQSYARFHSATTRTRNGASQKFPFIGRRIVRIRNGRVNRTSLCNKAEKWKSLGAKKRRPEFRDAPFAIATIQRPAKAATR